MSAHEAKELSPVADIIQTETIPVTHSTQAWIESLYQFGAVQFDVNGEATIEPTTRALIEAIHTVLAGGEVHVETSRPGGPSFDILEECFERAMAETNTALSVRDEESIMPYTP